MSNVRHPTDAELWDAWQLARGKKGNAVSDEDRRVIGVALRSRWEGLNQPPVMAYCKVCECRMRGAHHPVREEAARK